MKERRHRGHVKRPLRLTRRQFLGRAALVGGLGAGLTAAGWLISRRPHVPGVALSPTPTYHLDRPAVVSRADWGARPVDVGARNEHGYYNSFTNPEGWYVYPDDLRGSYQTVVIHHSAFYREDGRRTLLEVQRLHREDRGWADVGYHFMVDKDGTVYEGRHLSARGAHTQGYNTGSAGICLLGDFRAESPSSAQWQAVTALTQWLAYHLQLTHLAGHRQFNGWTVCPGGQVSSQLENLAELAGLQFGIDGYRSIGCACPTHI